MTFEEWVKVYEKKSGDTHKVIQGAVTLYDERRGYAQYGVSENKERLIIFEACGDGKHWYETGVVICRDNNIPAILTICIRNIEPYIRALKGKIEKKIPLDDRNGGFRYEGKNHLGKPFYAFPAWWDKEKQCNAYYVISFINEVEK